MNKTRRNRQRRNLKKRPPRTPEEILGLQMEYKRIRSGIIVEKDKKDPKRFNISFEVRIFSQTDADDSAEK